MAEMSRTFNFDDFNEQIEEALLEHGEFADGLRPALEPLPFGQKRPGEIGGVAIQLSFRDELFGQGRLFNPDNPNEPA